MNGALWVVQGLLTVAFGMAGTMKLVSPMSELAPMFGSTPPALIRFIGICEVGYGDRQLLTAHLIIEDIAKQPP